MFKYYDFSDYRLRLMLHNLKNPKLHFFVGKVLFVGEYLNIDRIKMNDFNAQVRRNICE